MMARTLPTVLSPHESVETTILVKHDCLGEASTSRTDGQKKKKVSSKGDQLLQQHQRELPQF